MRVKITLGGKGLIPFNYNLALAGAVYGPMKRVDPDLAYSIHSSTGYKFFTFSWLRVIQGRTNRKGIFVDGHAHFFVSSPMKDIISATLSPIIVKTAEEENGNLRVVGHQGNLIKKYKKLYNEERTSIDFSTPSFTKPVRIKIKDTFHRASHMILEAIGDTGLLRLGYEAGLGGKNSMGFGMVKVRGRREIK